MDNSSVLKFNYKEVFFLALAIGASLTFISIAYFIFIRSQLLSLINTANVDTSYSDKIMLLHLPIGIVNMALAFKLVKKNSKLLYNFTIIFLSLTVVFSLFFTRSAVLVLIDSLY